ncbi:MULTISPECIES: hypothetical protein [Clavibacter]|uniref:hypothetical protein n=1 Tax=Clavibacter TaxID=1573 RepID=UPI0004A0106B|nr:hypothetical protein [Clavibacter michiganensis]KDP91404.1 hypothetical protein W824_07255 [Clavibacter cf. michiganensis LMG 26808]
MTAVTLIRSAALADAAEYAYAATAPADARLIFLAGSCPLDGRPARRGRGRRGRRRLTGGRAGDPSAVAAVVD